MEGQIKNLNGVTKFTSRNVDKTSRLRQKYESIITEVNENSQTYEKNFTKLQNLILMEGIPSETEEEKRNFETGCSLRGRIWQILLRVNNVDAKKYVELVQKGPSSLYQKIRNDTFRTFPGNAEFVKRVPESKLIRVLNVFINSLDVLSEVTYVQGMNVVCAPFLYVMNEVDAFYTFSQFVTVACPIYWLQGIDGAYIGMKMMDSILKIVDPELFAHLSSKGQLAETYAMPPVLSFSGCTPPLEELLKLWDFFFAFGVHLNIIAVVAQIILNREELLNSEKPNSQLRTLPPLKADSIISVTVHIIREIPFELYEQLVVHTYLSKKRNIKDRRLSAPMIFSPEIISTELINLQNSKTLSPMRASLGRNSTTPKQRSPTTLINNNLQ